MTKKEKEVIALLNDLGTIYAQQASEPEFIRVLRDLDGDESAEGIILGSATSGTSAFNEWYAFRNREQAIKWISETFYSQSFVDGFTLIDGEFYDNEDTFYNEETDEPEVKEGAEVADIGDMIEAESRF